MSDSVVDSGAGFDASDWARLRRLMGLPMLSSGLSASRSSSSQGTLDLDFVDTVGDGSSGSGVGGGGGGVCNSILPLLHIDSKGGEGERGLESMVSLSLDDYLNSSSCPPNLEDVLYSRGLLSRRDYLGVTMPDLRDVADSITRFKLARPSTKCPGMVHSVSVQDLFYDRRYWLLPGMGHAKSNCGDVKFGKSCSNSKCKNHQKKIFDSGDPDLVYENCGNLDCSHLECRKAGFKRRVKTIVTRYDDLVEELSDAGYTGLEGRHTVLSVPKEYYPAFYSKKGFDLIRKESYYIMDRLIGGIGGLALFHAFRHTDEFKSEYRQYKQAGGDLGRWDYWDSEGQDMSVVHFSPHFHFIVVGFFRPDLVFVTPVGDRLLSVLQSGVVVPNLLRKCFESCGIDLGSDSMLYADSFSSWVLFDGDDEYRLCLNSDGSLLYVLQDFYERTNGWTFMNLDSTPDADEAMPGRSLEATVRYLLGHVARPYEEGTDRAIGGDSYYWVGAFTRGRKDERELTDADFTPSELSDMDCRYCSSVGKWVETCPACGSDVVRRDFPPGVSKDDIESGQVDWDEIYDLQPNQCTFRMKEVHYYFESIPKIVGRNYMLYSEIQDYLATTTRRSG